ncbi:hypothetical protein Cob_v011840 [Colletotrichum orbiculare MAFF 240422]|uniref:Uncharacterized protein n=1 Tax=Colletotrichum orbiculare (strain 104-T / ATCC 96160 / CBS 514.97 / LARS 414 / MAFF 240422) TaxID=1213857 RepID=A0A484FA85_COLOR|nr:hypothetical protein Cob_v011840 [Colletotrichum orbiculare MAFF 240422]
MKGGKRDLMRKLRICPTKEPILEEKHRDNLVDPGIPLTDTRRKPSSPGLEIEAPPLPPTQSQPMAYADASLVVNVSYR